MFIAKAYALIRNAWSFTAEKYPALAATSPESVAAKHFAVRHVLLHLQKSAAVVAAEAERADHGQVPDWRASEMAAKKLVVNALRLAELLGVTPEEVARHIEDFSSPEK